ncbi:hypothetical protein [Bacteroides sp.]
MENISNLIPPTPEKKSVRGWLSFFLFVVGFGSLFSLIMTITSSYPVDNDFFSYLAFSIDLLYALALVALACYTIHAFLYIRPNAVFLGRLYIIVIFVSNILTLLSGDMEDVGWGSLPQVVKALVWSLVWFTYLSLSNQVAELFPKENRKVFKRDKYFTAVLMAIPTILFLIYLLVYLGSGSAMPALSPNEGEYTDGVVAFRIPEYLSCEKIDSISDDAYHSFESGDSIWGMVVGVYDTNTTEEYFNECADSWRDVTLDGFDFSVLDSHTGLVNYNMLRIQSVQYVTDPRLNWIFAALFSPDTGKVSIVSCYATTSVESAETLVNGMLQTMRFK